MEIRNDTNNSFSISVGNSDSGYEMTGVVPGGSFVPTNVKSGEEYEVTITPQMVPSYAMQWVSPPATNDGTVTMSVTVK